MSPSKHLLYVNSKPIQVSDTLWEEWYKTEHLPDLVGAKSADRASFYEEIPNPVTGEPTDSRKFLALYQTPFEELLKSDEYRGIRTTSELFKRESSGSDNIGDNGDFNARYYDLWQEYDPKGVGEKPSPQILTVYMNPEDPDDFEKWYREEHLELLSRLPGYRRSLRYKLSATQTPLTEGSGPKEVQPYLAVHEVDDVRTFGSKEAEIANATEWTVKHIAQSHPFIARSWKLISAEGY